MQDRIDVAFMRGGTSKALVFKSGDLPEDRAAWDEIFLKAIGSPDPYGRQLNGMGGGLSSVSKVCVVGPPTLSGADLDYTFAQIGTTDRIVDYSHNCGNMTSAIGPFAVDAGLVDVPADSDEATVHIHNTNTGKLIASRFAVEGGQAVVDGDLMLPGVSGTGAPVALSFLEPSGIFGRGALPAGAPVSVLSDAGGIEATMVDSAAAGVFVRAEDIGLTGYENPGELEGNSKALETLERIRVVASVAMGVTDSAAAAADRPGAPKIGVIARPADYQTISGETVAGKDYDLSVRMISMGQPHRAIPLTGGLCAASGTHISGTLLAVAASLNTSSDEGQLRIGTPSGVVTFGATAVATPSGEWTVKEARVLRTARCLMEGRVLIPRS